MAIKDKRAAAGEWIPAFGHAVRDALTPGRGAPLQVTTAELGAAVVYATAIAIDPKEVSKALGDIEAAFKKSEPLVGFDERVSSAVLASERLVKARATLIAAAGMLGTHGGKVPDARLSPAAVVTSRNEADYENELVPGVHSGSVISSHPVSASGNAGQNAGMRLLCMAISVDGAQVVSLAQILASEGPLLEAVTAPFTAEARSVLSEVGRACSVRLSGGGQSEIVPPYRTQLLFPIKGGKYVAVSPLYSYSMGADLHARLERRRWAADDTRRQVIDSRIVHVGGARPWNTGLLATYISGMFQRLAALPPRQFEVDGGATVRRFRKGDLPIVSDSLSHDAIMAFLRAEIAHGIQPNVATQAARNERIGALCLEALRNLVVIEGEQSVSLSLHGVPIQIGPEVERGASRDIALFVGLLVNDGERVAPSADDYGRLARAVADRVTGKLHGRRPEKGGAPFVSDARFHDLVTGVAMQKIQERA